AVPHQGFTIAQAFVQDRSRIRDLESLLGNQKLGTYLAAAAFFADYAGEPDSARHFHELGISVFRKIARPRTLSIELRNLGRAEIRVGQLVSATAILASAQESARAAADK